MTILVTGSTGFLGRNLIPKLLAKGEHVVALARDTEKAKAILPKEVEVIKGDVTQGGLGIEDAPQLKSVYHLAGLLDLGKNKKDELYRINVGGMHNVLDFCDKNEVSHILFVSTAYTERKNDYEKSKEQAEKLLQSFNIPKITIFKPSILVADSNTLDPNGAVGLYHFAIMAAKVHHRVEVVRRWVEGNLRLPIIEPVLRVRGDPDGNLNLIPVDVVAKFIAETDDEGTFWVTHPNPPSLGDVVWWIGNGLLLRMVVKQDFRPTPIEALFMKLTEPFQPYLWGDELPTNLAKDNCPAITKEFISASVTRFILG